MTYHTIVQAMMVVFALVATSAGEAAEARCFASGDSIDGKLDGVNACKRGPDG
jgi:hypothetical protein